MIWFDLIWIAFVIPCYLTNRTVAKQPQSDVWKLGNLGCIPQLPGLQADLAEIIQSRDQEWNSLLSHHCTLSSTLSCKQSGYRVPWKLHWQFSIPKYTSCYIFIIEDHLFYFFWKNTWKYIQFHYQITVNDLNCVPKCKVFPALYTSLFLQASNVLCN